jgi:hypothetical protein
MQCSLQAYFDFKFHLSQLRTTSLEAYILHISKPRTSLEAYIDFKFHVSQSRTTTAIT